jgi:hypothetical protein
MKESPSDIKLREMLGPTVFSGEGFLGKIQGGKRNNFN